MSATVRDAGVTLVVGATGLLGAEIAAALIAAGRRVRALVRPGSEKACVERLRALGADLVSGDVVDRQSVGAALVGVEAVVSSATSMLRIAPGDTIEAVDRDGQLALVAAAAAAGISRFTLISFAPLADDFPLQRAKREVEAALSVSGVGYTVVQSAPFREVWLSPFLGFDPQNRSVRIYGSGDHPISYVAFADVAKFASAAHLAPSARNQVLPIGGPEALTQLQTVGIVERAFAAPMQLAHVSERELRDARVKAVDSKDQSKAGLLLSYALAEPVDSERALRLVPISRESTLTFLEGCAAPSRQ